MIQKEVNFKDGTRIYYEKVNGILQRFIEYSYSPQEIEELRIKPFLKDIIENIDRKHNAGKYYYLKMLKGMTGSLSTEQKHQLAKELTTLHDKVGTEYDVSIVREFPQIFGKYWKNNNAQCAAFFVTIYLAMLDLEENRKQHPNSLGKTMVLKSCIAVILDNKDPDEAAIMFTKKRKVDDTNDNYDMDDSYMDDSRFEKYHGYNGFDDETIDDAFDGFPEATWNVD